MSDDVHSITETNSIKSPADVRYGLGATAELADFAGSEGVERALVVTDADIVAAAVLDPIVNSLGSAGAAVDVFDGVEPGP